jgi:hypothetical protein
LTCLLCAHNVILVKRNHTTETGFLVYLFNIQYQGNLSFQLNC